MDDQADQDLFIASLTIAEIRRGILEKTAGRRRDLLETWFAGPEGPQALFARGTGWTDIDAQGDRITKSGNGQRICGFPNRESPK